MKKIDNDIHNDIEYGFDNTYAAHAKIEALVTKINEEIASIIANTEIDGENLDLVLDSLRSDNENFATATKTATDEIQDYIGARSEKWAETERGELYESWYETYTDTLRFVEDDNEIEMRVVGDMESCHIAVELELPEVPERPAQCVDDY